MKNKPAIIYFFIIFLALTLVVDAFFIFMAQKTSNGVSADNDKKIGAHYKSEKWRKKYNIDNFSDY